MTSLSVLFPKGVPDDYQTGDQTPEFFIDLNLDQVIASITFPKKQYNLKDYFCNPLQDIEVIRFRQDVFKDLELPETMSAIKAFAEKMTLVGRYLELGKKGYYSHYQEGWFLEAAINYCDGVSELANRLNAAIISSRGLSEFKVFLDNYIADPEFVTLKTETGLRKQELSEIRFNVNIKGSLVRVRRYESEVDESVEVENVFRKFQQGNVKKYRINLTSSGGTSHVDAQILDCVAKLFPTAFQNLHSYYVNSANFQNETITLFDHEIQFYVSYLDFIEKIRAKGLGFCYPTITQENKDIHIVESFDIALASKLALNPEPIICNSFHLGGKERVIVVSGPNQGGKTTFARMFGQLHFLAKLGCPVPGQDGTLFLYDQIYTHFENEEEIKNLRGKLQDDLVRVHSIFESASSTSIIILNEIFTSTALKDAVFLSKQIMEKIIGLDCLCVWVTFLEELSALGEQTVSMVSNIVPGDPTQRTYKIERKSADGLSYAIPLAEKHHLTYQAIKERISQ